MLGKGANGEAWLAFKRDYISQEPDFSDKYVIKKVPLGNQPVLSKSDKLREIQLLAMIRHPYIVTYDDCWIEDGTLFVVMEFAGGGTMEKYCDKGTPVIPLQLLYDSFVQAMLAVAYLHERSIVHRDLKPANVFVLDDNSVKLGDLGEGWITHGDQKGSAQERWANAPAQKGQIVGTPYYLAPECWMGTSTDLDKADVWAMGVLLYELCTKSRPFVGRSVQHLAVNACKQDVPFPSGETPGTLKGYPDDALEEVVKLMLEKKPERRPTCREVLACSCIANALLMCR